MTDTLIATALGFQGLELTHVCANGCACCGELLQLGLMVLENNMKDASGKHKVDMTAYYEELFFNVVVCRNLMERATEGGDMDKTEIHKLVNRMFRGDSEKFD